MILPRALSGASFVALAFSTACTLDFDLSAPGEGGASGQTTASQTTSAQGGASGTGGSSTGQGGGSTSTSATCPGICIPPAPAGFSGPIRYLSNSVGTCTGPAELGPPAGVASDGVLASPAVCKGCSCTLTSASLCGQLAVDLSSVTTCNATAPIGITAGSCVSPGANVTAKAIGVTKSSAGGASCSTSGGGLAVPLQPAVYATPIEACSLVPAGTCGGSETCVDDGEAYCVYQAGKGVACDASSPYVVAREIGAGLVDDRGCSACGCAPTCAGKLALFSDVGCSTQLAVAPTVSSANATCTVASVSVGSVRYEPSATACDASGAASVGGADAAAAFTLCCTQ